MNRDTSEARRLTEAATPNLGDWGPTFSRDGRYLAFVRERAVATAAIFVVPMSSTLNPTDAPTRVTPDGGIRSVAWTPGDDELVFSRGGHLSLGAVFRVGIPPTRADPVREPDLLPFGAQALEISISATGRLVYAASSHDANIWKVDLTDSANPPRLQTVVPSTLDEHTPDYSPDGKRLAFASNRTGVEELWVAAADGSNPVQVTSMGGPQCANPRWSADSRTILFNSRKKGSADLYLLRPDSGELRQITNDPGEEVEPQWSRDGRTIYFGSNRSGRYEIWKIPAGGGAAVQITHLGGVTAAESVDGRFLYYAKNDQSPTALWRVPVGGGEETRIADGLTYSSNFVVTERGIYFLAKSPAEPRWSLDWFDFATGSRTTLFDVPKLRWWFGMALSPDRRWLLYSSLDRSESTLMMVDHFQ